MECPDSVGKLKNAKRRARADSRTEQERTELHRTIAEGGAWGKKQPKAENCS